MTLLRGDRCSVSVWRLEESRIALLLIEIPLVMRLDEQEYARPCVEKMQRPTDVSTPLLCRAALTWRGGLTNLHAVVFSHNRMGEGN